MQVQSKQGRRRFHIVLSRTFDLETMERGASDEQNPRHAMHTLARILRAKVHDPAGQQPNWLDRLLGRVVATPEHWAMARKFARTLDDDDVIYSVGVEGLAIPLCTLFRRRRPGFAMSLMSPDNRKMRALLGLPLLARAVDMVVVSNEHKRHLVGELTAIPEERVFVLPEQTDTVFFKPGPSSQARERPLLFAPGLEQRDYRTLAQAIAELDVDCVVCAMSPNAVQDSSIFPEQLPPNMVVTPLPWPAFRQAYRDAALVVVPLRQNLYSAGSTAVMEALACKRPVIITDIPGIAHEFSARKLVATAPAGDAASLRQRIVELLSDPALAEGYAARGHAAVLHDHTLEIVMGQLGAHLGSLGHGHHASFTEHHDEPSVPTRTLSAAPN